MANTTYNSVGFAMPRISGLSGAGSIGANAGLGAGYRKKGSDDADVLRMVKRFVLTTAAIAAIAYVGARADFDTWLEERFQGRKELAESYADVSFYKRLNAEGRLEPMLVYFQNGERRELPVLHGVEGPQAGSLEYVLDNTDFSRLTPEQRAKLPGSKPWDDKAWEKLDVSMKYRQIRDEVLKMLR